MRERAPNLPEVKPTELATLRTLGQIVNHMKAAGAAAGPSTPPGLTGSVVAPVVAGPSIDLEALMMTIVAEKTGYPREMLGAHMELEADLGIDSIKRVEILSAMRERAPNLPEVKPTELATLRTLGQIVNHMKAAGAALGPCAGGGSGCRGGSAGERGALRGARSPRAPRGHGPLRRARRAAARGHRRRHRRRRRGGRRPGEARREGDRGDDRSGGCRRGHLPRRSARGEVGRRRRRRQPRGLPRLAHRRRSLRRDRRHLRHRAGHRRRLRALRPRRHPRVPGRRQRAGSHRGAGVAEGGREGHRPRARRA